MSRILIVDDEASICWSLERLLSADGHAVTTVSSAEQAFEIVEVTPPDAVILDVRLPGISGLDAIPKLRRMLGPIPVILITAFGDLDIAVQAVNNQVTEYLTKPFDLDYAAEVVRRALRLSSIANDGSQSSSSGMRQHEVGRNPQVLVGSSPAMQEVFKRIALASGSHVPVLITGESGTGKELVAEAIHAHSPRKVAAYIPVTLPALNPSLIESEFFGHARGAFTGATERRDGLFAIAHGGTVLLDEIGDLPLPQQVKLLRVLEQGQFTPVGDTRPLQCDVRIVAATHQDLPQKVRQGDFREDLYFRLAVFEIRIPALRERKEDLPVLSAHFLSRIGYAQPELALDDETIKELEARPWRGNVRELRNTLEHASLLARGGRIGVHHLPAAQETVSASPDSSETLLTTSVRRWFEKQQTQLSNAAASIGIFERFLSDAEPTLLRCVLDTTRGNRAAASQLLGIHRATLREKLRRYDIDPDDS